MAHKIKTNLKKYKNMVILTPEERVERIAAEMRGRKPNPIFVENDCEDQGFSNLAQGCLRWECGVWRHVKGKDILIHPAFVIEKRNGHQYWQCPMCKGNYGEIK